MNLTAWAKQGVPIEILALKLCEEAGEVSTEVTDGWKRGEIDRLKMLDELDQVIAIAGILKERLTP